MIADYQRGNDREQIQSGSQVVVNQPAIAKSSALEKLVTLLPAMIPAVLKYIEGSAERRNREMLMMMKMMSPQSASGIADITKVGVAMAELQKVFGAGAAASGTGEITDFIPQALNILESVLVKKGTEDQSKSRLTSGAPPAPTNVRAIRGASGIPQSIAAMAPNAAAKTIIDALGAMNPDKRQAAISEFMREFQRDVGNSADVDEEDDFDTGFEQMKS
jgi:hypothetical protein